MGRLQESITTDGNKLNMSATTTAASATCIERMVAAAVLQLFARLKSFLQVCVCGGGGRDGCSGYACDCRHTFNWPENLQ